MKKLFFLFTLAVCAFAQSGKTKAKPAGGKPEIAAAAIKVSALDKTTLENYVRHLFVWDHTISVEISDPKPAPMAGFVEVNVHAFKDKASQDMPLYISKDGQNILRGDVYQTAQNPFKTDLDKLNGTTAFQPNYGTQGAPVVIVEFSDFQCPYCRTEAQTLRKNILTSYPKEVHLYHFDMPIESLHPWARAAAIAGRCVYKQNADAFWSYYDWIYEHQADITADNLKSKILEWAKDKSNVDSLQLTRCMETKQTDSEVQQSLDLAKSLQVNQTPMFFVNGRRMAGAVEWADLRRVIDEEISYQKTAKNAGEDCGCSVTLPSLGMPAGSAAPGALK